jgi:ferredoxin
MSMRVTANTDTCVSSGICAYREPEVFGQDDDGAVTVLDPEPPADRHDAIRDVAEACPTSSIRVSGGAS